MNPDNRRKGKSDNNNRTAKAISAMPIAGIVVAASLLLSGLALISSYQQPVIAQQQNMTGGGGGNATSAGGASQSEVMMHLEEVRKALQNNDVQGAMMHLDLAMNLLSGGGSAQGNMTTSSTTGSTYSTG
jgi:hypothetical protein